MHMRAKKFPVKTTHSRSRFIASTLYLNRSLGAVSAHFPSDNAVRIGFTYHAQQREPRSPLWTRAVLMPAEVRQLCG